MRLLTRERRVMLALLVESGLSQRQVAKRLHVAKNTVARYSKMMQRGIDITNLDDYDREGAAL